MSLKEIKSTHKIPFIPLEHSKYKTEMILLKMWYLIKSTHKISFIPLEHTKYITEMILLKMWLFTVEV